jgi:hypothetical protein
MKIECLIIYCDYKMNFKLKYSLDLMKNLKKLFGLVDGWLKIDYREPRLWMILSSIYY